MGEKAQLVELGDFLNKSKPEQIKYMRVNTELVLSLIHWIVNYTGLAYRAGEAYQDARTPKTIYDG
jgi:hypothetical protein